MNKTFTAAIAITAVAGLACAEIATDPAGYVDVTLGDGASAFVINPFNAFDGTLKLGDIDGSELKADSTIKVIGANGKQLFKAKWNPASGDSNGWCLWDGANYGANTNAHSFQRGESVQFVSGADNEIITMAGTLNTNNASITCVKGHNFVGNVAPVSKNLSAFTVTGDNYSPLGSDYIFVDGKKMVYLNATLAARAGKEAGWYLKADVTGSNPKAAVAQNPPIDAGTGFRAYFTKDNVSINAPGL